MIGSSKVTGSDRIAIESVRSPNRGSIRLPTNGSTEFLKYNFAITGDLCKQFITVVSGVPDFSLAFSEKIANFATAKRDLRNLLAIAWASMLFAIIASGLGLTYICLAGGQAVYGRDDGYLSTAWTSYYRWIIAAEMSFVIGLVSLICAALACPFISDSRSDGVTVSGSKSSVPTEQGVNALDCGER
jgi:hypothetical protein